MKSILYKIKNKIFYSTYFQNLIFSLLKKRADGILSREDLIEFFKKFPAGKINVVSKVNFILDYCRGKRVLHLGFVDYPFTESSLSSEDFMHNQLKKVAANLIGIDNNEESVNFYKEKTGDKNVIVGNVYELEKCNINWNDIDILLLGEILEHLDSPGSALTSINNVINEKTEVIVTVPNAMSINVFCCCLHNIELVHSDHVGWYSPHTLTTLFKRHNLFLKDLLYYQFGRDSKVNPLYLRYPYLSDGIIGIFSKSLR